MTKVKFKTLVLFVSSYPSPIGEMFIENELKVLQEKFGKIWIIQTKFLENYKYHRLFKPNNSEKKIMYETKINKARSIVRLFFSKYFFSEISMILKTNPKKLVNYKIYKDLIYYYLGSEKKKYWLKNFIFDNNIDLKTTLFYTYWCDENTFLLTRYNLESQKIHYISRLHSWDLYYERHNSNFLPFRTIIFNSAWKIFPISKNGNNYITKKLPKVAKSKFFISYLGVENLKLNNRYTNLLTLPKKPYLEILTLSYISPIKGLEKLINSLSKISDFKIHWHHIGWGIKEYEQKIRSASLELMEKNQNIKITFHGKLSQIKVKEFLETKEIDVLINCSDQEGIPVTMMEACSAGIPIIAYPVGGIPEIVKHNYNGFLIPLNNSDFSEQIRSFNYLNSDEKKRLSNNAQNFQRNEFNAIVNYSNFFDTIQTKKYFN